MILVPFSQKNHNWFLFCFSCDGRIGIQKKSLSPAAIRLEKETKKTISPWYHSSLVQILHPLCHISAIMCFSITGESRQCLLCRSQQFCTAAQGGDILLSFDCLTPTDSSLQRTNSIFFPVNAFFLIRAADHSAAFSLFYRIFLDLSSVFLIFPYFFPFGQIFGGKWEKPYTFFVQTVKIRTECLILSKQGAILKHRYIFLYPCPEGVCHVYQSYFSNRRTSVSAHRTVSPSHWLRGMWHGCKQIGISGLTKQTRDILFIWNCFFTMPPVRLLPKAFFKTAAGKRRFRKRAANESHKKKSKRWKL